QTAKGNDVLEVVFAWTARVSSDFRTAGLWCSMGGAPVAASAAYALPFPVEDGAAAVRLAARLEERVAGVYSDLVRATTGARRADAAGALREAAVRAVRWSGGSVAFPGLAERSGERTGAAGTAPSPSGSPTR
ncbi:DUF4439 domain-containing protein, partial [Streptomyces sp. NPDC004658]|uniref:DUF4439 domain-containing protein n=1 Tax=Streptomyces sp. NPDC004658 TaxID=3154672 RepID=UPI0033A9E4F0